MIAFDCNRIEPPQQDQQARVPRCDASVENERSGAMRGQVHTELAQERALIRSLPLRPSSTVALHLCHLVDVCVDDLLIESIVLAELTDRLALEVDQPNGVMDTMMGVNIGSFIVCILIRLHGAHDRYILEGRRE